MITGVHHIGLAACDLAAAARFHGGLIDADPSQVLLTGLNLRIELHATGETRTAGAAPALNRPGLRHYCVQNFNCEDLAAKVRAGGGQLIAAPLDLGTGNQYAYVRDPEGNILEIEGLPYAPPEQASWIGHIALVTRDIEAAINFYAVLLQISPPVPRSVGPSPAIDRMGGLSGAALRGAWLPAGNIALEFWQFDSPSFAGPASREDFSEPGFSHVAFESDDPDRDLERLLDLGAKVPAPAFGALATPGAAVTRFATGPDDVLIELVRMADPALGLNGLSDRTVVSRIEER